LLKRGRSLCVFPPREGRGGGGQRSDPGGLEKGLTERGKTLSALTEKVRHGLHARLYPRRS